MKYSINGIRCTHSACTYVQLKRNILFWVEKCFWYKEVFVKCHFWSRRRTAAFFLSSAKNRGFLLRTVKRKYINYHVFLAYFSRYVSSYFLNCHMYMYMWVSRSGSGPTPPPVITKLFRDWKLLRPSGPKFIYRTFTWMISCSSRWMLWVM